MKSIMEEASSITKAIEKAWARAGKPQEFSVKVLEHPETNFFGLKTVKSAKIALLFSEQVARASNRPENQQRPQRQASPQKVQQRPLSAEGENTERPRTHQARPERQERRHEYRERTESRSENRGEGRTEGRSEFQRRPRPERHERGSERGERGDRYDRNEPRDTWTPEMVQGAQEWLKETLTLMGHLDVHVNPHVSQNYLKLQLDKPIAEDARHEELQLKSWGNLIIESMREKYHKPLRSLRVIIESRRPSRTPTE